MFAGSVSSVSLETLSSAFNERMQVMKQVADYKALRHLPVEDLPGEQVVLENTRQAGREPHSVEPLVPALINVSKAIQYRYLAGAFSRAGSRGLASQLAAPHLIEADKNPFWRLSHAFSVRIKPQSAE